MFGSVVLPGESVIEKVHGLQCTSISLNERFTLSTAEYLGRMARLRKRPNAAPIPRLKWFVPNQMTQHMKQTARRQPVRQRLGMPGLRRFGSEGNLPGLRRSNSVNQLQNRIRWNNFNSSGNLSRAGSIDNMSNASWHGRTGYVRRRDGNFGQFRGRLRGRGRQQQRAAAGRGARGARGVRGARGAPLDPRREQRDRGRGRGGIYRNQQNRQQKSQLDENQPNNNQNRQFNKNRNQPVKTLTKEELDAQLDQYMALSQHVLDKELDEYMLKGALMEIE